MLQVAATAGYNVTLVEVNSNLVEQSLGSIKNSLSRVAKKQIKDDAVAQNKFIADTVGRIGGSSNLTDAVKSTDLVIEAIVENISIKHKLFESIDKVGETKKKQHSSYYSFYPFSMKGVIRNNLIIFRIIQTKKKGCSVAHNIRIEYIVFIDWRHCIGDQSQRTVRWITLFQSGASDETAGNCSHQ